MFEQLILGVDPGVASTGLAAVRGGSRRSEIVWSTTVRTPAGLAEPLRLDALHQATGAAIAEHHPDAVAIERLMWGRNVGSAMGVARASGVLLLAAAEAGVPVFEYAPLEVKMAVTGSGTAGKADIRRFLGMLGIADVPTQPDAADAVAVAICHLTGAALRQATEAAR